MRGGENVLSSERSRRRRPNKAAVGVVVMVVVWLGLAVPAWSAPMRAVNVSLAPTSVVAGSSHAFVFTFTDVNAGTGTISIVVPKAASGTPWTAPQVSNPAHPGFVAVNRGSCNSAGSAGVTGTGPWTITASFKCSHDKTCRSRTHGRCRPRSHRRFTVTYGARGALATAPTKVARDTFATSVNDGHVFRTATQPKVAVTAGRASALQLGDLRDGAVAGTGQTLTVTAQDRYGNTANGYRGTVDLTSSDPKAALPAKYRFTAGDAGSHTFSVTLKTAGSRTVTVRDTARATLTATSRPAAVSPASASHLIVVGPPHAVAGHQQTVVVRALDSYGNAATGYTGTVAFSSSDPQTSLPSNYHFTAADGGVHSFAETLKTSGPQTVTARDTTSPGIEGTQTVVISAGPAAALQLTPDPSLTTFDGSPLATAGQTFNVTLAAIDQYGNTATGYTGTVALSSSDDQTPIPGGNAGSGTVQFSPGDSGSITLPGIAFFTKKIYFAEASLTAVDTTNSQITGALNFQVLPGRAVGYACPAQPDLITRDANGDLTGVDTLDPAPGVNDELGLQVIAVDQYGNNATNRVPQGTIGALLPAGYEGAAPQVSTSDPQAVIKPGSGFSANPPFIGTPPVDITLRSAGAQSVTITDPNNPNLTQTCIYQVDGPRAYTGTVNVPTPQTTGNTTVQLTAFSYLPPNDPGVTFNTTDTPLNPPQVNDPNVSGQLDSFGVVSPSQTGPPTIFWDLDPTNPPAGTITCDTQGPCSVSGPEQIHYTIQDQYGNHSTGTITIKPWHPTIPPGIVQYASTMVGASIQCASAGCTADGNGGLVLGTTYHGNIVRVSDDSATVQVGSTMINVGNAANSGLTVGAPVSMIIDKPLVVSGAQPDCTPTAGVSCEPSSFADVTIILGDTRNPSKEVPGEYEDQIFGMCAGNTDLFCPDVSVNVVQPPPATVGSPYSFQFTGGSSLSNGGEFLTFVASGSPNSTPPGLTLSASGLLSGVPTTPGVFGFFVQANGVTSGAVGSHSFTMVVNSS